MSSLTRLLLIRHGESVGNVQGIMQGSGSGSGTKAAPYDRLTPQGYHQALALGHHLAQPAPQTVPPTLGPTAPPTHLYSSPARRTQQTLSALLWAYRFTLHGATWADLQQPWQGRSQPTDQDCLDFFALDAADRPVHDPYLDNSRLDDRPNHDRPPDQFQLDDRLQEINNGIFCGLTWTQAQQQYPDLCQQLLHSPDWVPIPQAETPQQCHDRAQAWIQTVTKLPPGSHIWAMTHGGILPYLWAALLGSDRTWGFTAAHTACFELCWDGDRWQSVTHPSAIHPNPTQPNPTQPSQTQPSTPQPHNTRHNTTLWHIAQFNNTDHYRLLSASAPPLQ